MKVLLTIALLFSAVIAEAQEFKVITTIESIVPMGLGRSRIVEAQQETNVDAVTTERVDGKKSDQKEVKRKEMRIDQFSESKLLNFYSAAGINFQNIATNDALITDRINKLVSEGWDLAFVTSAVESDSGETDGQGIFITRYIFKR